MRFRPAGLLIAGVVAAGAFAGGVRLYWNAQDRHASQYLLQALQANAQQRRQGLATTRIATSRGWLVSTVQIDYENPDVWQISYLNPALANSRISRQPGIVWRRVSTAPPQQKANSPVIQQTNTSTVRLASGLGNYNATNMGSEKVAGRPVTIIGLIDKGDKRLVRAFWIDNATHVFLRQDLLNPEGQLVSSTEFTRITFPKKPLVDKAAPPTIVQTSQPRWLGTRMNIQQLSRAAGFQVRAPQGLSPNFRLKDSYLLPCPCGCKGHSIDLHFSDGVRSLSVFEMDNQRKDCCVNASFIQDTGKVIPGPSPALKAAVEIRGNILVVVIGDLPSERLQRIARSF